MLREKGFGGLLMHARTKHGYDQAVLEFYGNRRAIDQGIEHIDGEDRRKIFIYL